MTPAVMPDLSSARRVIAFDTPIWWIA